MAYADKIHPCLILSVGDGRWEAMPIHWWEYSDAFDYPQHGHGQTAAEALADLAHQLLGGEG